jgi:hypothetical protein
VTPGQDGDPAAAEQAGPAAAGPPDRGRAETYLRLRAEAELRRVQALPRPDPPGERVLPAPLRGAARLVLPPGRRAAGVLLPLAGQAAQALQPLAQNATRTLQPLADTAGRTLPPLAGNAARALQPLADTAAQTAAPLAEQVIGVLRPAADQAARRLHPLAWEAAYRLQALRRSGEDQVTRWGGRAHRATAALRGTRAAATPARWTPDDMSAEEGVHRLRRVADALVQAGALDRGSAGSVLAGLETALAARSRIDPHLLSIRDLRASRHRQAATAPAGRYLAAPVGVTTAAGPDSGLAEISLFTLVLAPDRAALTVAGQMSGPRAGWAHQRPWPLFPGPGHASVTDDRGNDYDLHDDSGWTDSDGDWGAVLGISPIPPAGTRWLELTMRPGSPAIRVDLTGPGAGGQAASGPAPAGLPPEGSPAERLIDAAAGDLLRLAVASGDEGLAGHDLSGVTDIVTALDAVGALAPARDAVGRLLALAGRLGVAVPPALSAAAPPGELPAAWADVLRNRHRRDGRPGTAAAAGVLPELDGARFVVAGLRSHAAGASLRVLGWGRQRPPRLLADGTDESWSWYARDDQGRWHVATEGSYTSDDHHIDVQLDVVPPLHPEATALDLILSGRSGRVTASLRLDWMEPT